MDFPDPYIKKRERQTIPSFLFSLSSKKQEKQDNSNTEKSRIFFSSKPNPPSTNRKKNNQKKISTSSWTSEQVEYVLRRFDAGALPGQILIEMRSNGYATLDLETIEQCLRVNGRAVDGLDPSVRTPIISNTFDARGYQGQPNSYFGDSSSNIMVGRRAGGGGVPAKSPHVPPSNFRPQSYQ